MKKQSLCTQFCAIRRIFNCFLVRNFSTIPRNEICASGSNHCAQLQRLIPRNGIPIVNSLQVGLIEEQNTKKDWSVLELHITGFLSVLELHNTGFLSVLVLHNTGFLSVLVIHNTGFWSVLVLHNTDFWSVLVLHNRGFWSVLVLHNRGFWSVLVLHNTGFWSVLVLHITAFWSVLVLHNTGFWSVLELHNTGFWSVLVLHNTGFWSVLELHNTGFFSVLVLHNTTVSGRHDPGLMIHISDFWFWNYIVFNPVLNQGPGVWFGLLVLNSAGSWTVQLVRHGKVQVPGLYS